MKSSFQIATLALTAGVAFALGWNMRSGDPDSADAADPIPGGSTKSNRVRPADSGRMTSGGRATGGADAGSRADLHVRFATHGVIGGLVLGPAFQEICNQLVDAFGRRAHQVYRGG